MHEDKLGDRIKQLRNEKDLTQEELADQLSLNRANIANWETNRALPDANTILQLADFFNVTTDYLMGSSDAPQTAFSPKAAKLLKAISLAEELPEEKISELADILETFVELQMKKMRKKQK